MRRPSGGAPKVYLAQAATLLFLFTIIAALGAAHRPAGGEEPAVLLPGAPADGFVFGLLLVYEPALLDILPMYIFFMLLSPWVLAFGCATAGPA